ncbi:MAG: 2-dehydropantoate 2-reductase [Syntrophus sp. SKADARSKE-3]|nr:2-dehydropantoate 2-reductase [Syntrophus sp. SKADARSKE-3]
MKISIFGTGGVGGYFGGLLAKSGQDVTFIARGPHLQAIRKKGLLVKSVFGDFDVSPAQVTDKPSEAGSADLIIVATKTYHTDDAAQAIKPMVGPDTVVMSLQNGVDSAIRIGQVVGMEHMIGGATWLSAAIEAPGVIGQYSQFRRIVFGEFNGQKTPRVEKIYDLLSKTGATIELVEDINKVLWTKYVFIASASAIGCLTRATFGEYRQVPETRAVLTAAINEVKSVAQANGILLDSDITEKTLAFIDGSAPVIKTSMHRDIEAGKVSELESMIGFVVQLGKKLNVPTPIMIFAYAMLKPAQLKALAAC